MLGVDGEEIRASAAHQSLASKVKAESGGIYGKVSIQHSRAKVKDLSPRRKPRLNSVGE